MVTDEDWPVAREEPVLDRNPLVASRCRSTFLDLDQRLIALFESVLGPEAEGLEEDAGPGSIDAWDSVNHLNLVLAIESEFGVHFETSEIPELLSRAAIRARLERAG